MIARYLVTELGQTYCAVFDSDDDRIVLAAGVETTEPDLLDQAGQLLFERWYQDGLNEPLTTGAWLQREYAEGRATAIVAHFEVNA